MNHPPTSTACKLHSILGAFVIGIATLVSSSSANYFHGASNNHYQQSLALEHKHKEGQQRALTANARNRWCGLPTLTDTATARTSAPNQHRSNPPAHRESLLHELRGGGTDDEHRSRPNPPSPRPPLLKRLRARTVESLVADGVSLIESEGSSVAFRAMGRKGSRWFRGSTYLFAYDKDCNVLFNAAAPEKVGRNTKGQGDKDGKLFHDALVAQGDGPDGCGWVNYMWPKPGQNKPSQKWTYSKAVTIDGKPAVLMSGFY